MDSRSLVDYEFEQRTDYDLRLMKELKKVKIKKNIKKYVRNCLPDFAVKLIKNCKEKKHE
jgi:hypothetical protein